MLSGLAEVDPSCPVFAYVQVADILTAGIQAGQITGKLPAERELAAALGVSYVTLRRAIGLLRERGLVVTLHGRGNFVTHLTPPS